MSTILNSGIAKHLADAHLDASAIASLIELTIAEDLADGVDVTSVATVPEPQYSILDLVARQPGVTAGVWVAAAVFDLISDHDAEIDVRIEDGSEVKPGDVLVSIKAHTRHLLVGERTALNLFCHLSGVATATHAWALKLEGTNARVRDTRKTMPFLRALEKYAVRCGGGVNHRMSLSDAALVKDNHIVAAGGVRQAFEAVRSKFPGIPVEVEVDTIEQLHEVLGAGADLVLLDNFTLDEMREAVAINAGRATLEASGGLTLDNAYDVGHTGVDYIAVGALTHSAPVLDIGADLRAL